MSEFIDRYVRVWHLSDPEERRRQVETLWAPDAVEVTTNQTFRGHDELYQRVTDAYAELVADGKYRFISAGDEYGHHDLLMFTCQMLPTDGDEILWQARMVFRLTPDGRISHEDQVEIQLLAA